jgi:hypothetical protein
MELILGKLIAILLVAIGPATILCVLTYGMISDFGLKINFWFILINRKPYTHEDILRERTEELTESEQKRWAHLQEKHGIKLRRVVR